MWNRREPSRNRMLGAMSARGRSQNSCVIAAADAIVRDRFAPRHRPHRREELSDGQPDLESAARAVAGS